MNPVITRVADTLMVQAMAIGTDLAKQSTPQLVDLQHESREQRLNPDFTIRTAAEMLEANCTILLERRAAEPGLRRVAVSGDGETSHSAPPAAKPFKHYAGCPAIEGAPVCTCGGGRFS